MIALCLLIAAQAKPPSVAQIKQIRGAYEKLGAVSFESTLVVTDGSVNGKESWTTKFKTFFGNRLNWRVEQRVIPADEGKAPAASQTWCENGVVKHYGRTSKPGKVEDWGTVGVSFIQYGVPVKRLSRDSTVLQSVAFATLMGNTDWMTEYSANADLTELSFKEYGPGSSVRIQLDLERWIVAEYRDHQTGNIIDMFTSSKITHSQPKPLRNWRSAVHFEPPASSK